jgi:hypothetical protein
MPAAKPQPKRSAMTKEDQARAVAKGTLGIRPLASRCLQWAASVQVPAKRPMLTTKPVSAARTVPPAATSSKKGQTK